MFYIIEKKEQLDELVIAQSCFIKVIPLNTFYHPKLTSPSLIYYKPLNSKGYIICVNHSESFNIDFNDVLEFIKKHKVIYTLDSKKHMYFLPEVETIDLLYNNDIDESEYDTEVHKYFYQNFKENSEVDKIIPITKHYEKYERIYRVIIGTGMGIDNITYSHYHSIFYRIEQSGIKISKVFFKHFEITHEAFSIKDDIIYTQYNLYNNTTRPSNSFNGINFSALTKSSRVSFIPRNDMFIEIDFEGFHPRLIADKINYILDDSTPVYEQLCRLYFGESVEITDEYIKQSKEYTFKQIYGGIEKQYENLEYFSKINAWIDEEWQKYKTKGYLELYGGKQLTNVELTRNQLFNYLIQSLETYTNIQLLQEFLPLLETTKTKMIHYVYDSFLFDVDKSEKEILDKVIKIISKKFPIRISHGLNYKDMVRL